MRKHEGLPTPPASLPKFNKTQHKTQWLPIGSLTVKWPQAQRSLIESHAKQLASTLNLDLLDVIHVSLPDAKGKHHIIDGQTRVAALRIVGFNDETTVQCVVHQVADAASCARLFVELNTGRRAPNAIDKYLTAVTAGYPDFGEYVDVDEIVRACGFEVTNVPGDGHIRCVVALMTNYRRFAGATSRKALETIRETWGEDQNALIAGIVSGYGVFINAHDAELDYDRLVDIIQKRFTPGQLKAKARAKRELDSISEGAAVSEILADTYNKGLRHNKLKNGAA